MLIVRPLEKSERDTAVRLLAVQLEEHGVDIANDTLARAIDGVLEQPSRGLFLIAERDAKTGAEMIGIAYLSFQWTLEHGGQIAWLEELYVVPDEREKGAGTKLLDAVITEAGARGCRAIDLEIEQGHDRVASLYQRTGFKQLTRARWAKKLNS